MDFPVLAQNWLSSGWVLPALAMIGLAAAVWLLSRLLFPETKSSSNLNESLQGLEGLDERMVRRLWEFGIESDRDLIRLAPRGQQELISQLGLHAGEYTAWREQILHRWRSTYLPEQLREVPDIYPDPELGGLYSKKPNEADVLTELEGITQLTADRLNATGIYTFQQLRLLTQAQQENLRRRFQLDDFDFDRVGLVGADDRVAKTSRDSSQAPLVSSAAAIKSSVGNEPESKHTTGLCNHATASQGADQMQTPVAQPVGPPERSIEPGPATPVQQVETSDQSPTHVGEATDDVGYTYSSPPMKPDDLSRLAGVTAEQAEQLNSAGIYTYSQLRSLNAQQQENVRHRFGLADLDFGQLQSMSTGSPHANADDTRQPSMIADEDLGSLYSSPPPNPDDLTRLQGIDAMKAGDMHAAGIHTFDQVHSLSPRQQSVLRDRFDLHDADFTDWSRCISAWGRGIQTESEDKLVFPTGCLHGIRLPEIVPGVFDGQTLVAYREQVIFRGSNPEFWGQDVRSVRGGAIRALPAAAIRSDINFVRLRRVDTRQSVVTAITKDHLFAEGPADGNGWHGVCDHFFGGRHLGICAREIPHEVEIKYGLGGWGFGHRFEHNDQQECGWHGRIIESTAFEITVGRIGTGDPITEIAPS